MSFSNSDTQIFYRDATELARLIRTKGFCRAKAAEVVFEADKYALAAR